MPTSTLWSEYRQALAGVHAFSGNDYVSCLFRKGNKMFWKMVVKNPTFVKTFVKTFAELGLFNRVTPEIKSSREICFLYGRKHQKSVNMVRKSIFLQKYANDKWQVRRPHLVATMWIEFNILPVLTTLLDSSEAPSV